MQKNRCRFITKRLTLIFLVLSMLFFVCASNGAADDRHHRSNKYDSHKFKASANELRDDEGNELTGEFAAWLFAMANLPVLFGLLYRSVNRFGSLTENTKKRLKNFKTAQKKYLMPFHYLINIIALLLAIMHFNLSNCRSSSLPELGLALMACIVVVGIMLKMNVTPKGVRGFIFKIHTNPLTIGLVVSVLLVGHRIVD